MKNSKKKKKNMIKMNYKHYIKLKKIGLQKKIQTLSYKWKNKKKRKENDLSVFWPREGVSMEL
jgi:hypothetical protein